MQVVCWTSKLCFENALVDIADIQIVLFSDQNLVFRYLVQLSVIQFAVLLHSLERPKAKSRLNCNTQFENETLPNRIEQSS